MTPEQIILEKWFGYTVQREEDGLFTITLPDGGAHKRLFPSDVLEWAERETRWKFGSLQKAAEKAAEWFNGQDNSVFYCHSVWIFTEDSAHCNPVTGQTRWLFRPIELIAEALKAGWEG